jgi:tight adherence protein C
MRDLIFSLILTAGISATAVPFVMKRCDKYLTKRRLETRSEPVTARLLLQDESKSSGQIHAAHRKRPDTWSHADCFESLSRSSRHNATAADAVLALPTNIPPIFSEVVQLVRTQQAVTTAISTASPRASHDDDRSSLWLLQAALVHGFFVPHALDRAAVVVREIATARDELTVASAQSRLSARILTFIPIALAGVAALVSEAARETMFGTVNGCVVLFIGLGLSWLGWKWIHRLIARVNADPLDHAALIAVIDAFAVSLRAGLTITQSFERVAEIAPASVRAQCGDLARALHHGVSLHDAIIPLREVFGSRSAVFIDMVLSADRDGLPLVNLVDRLSEEARRQRQRDTDIRIRQVPARLTFPLVFCILPSFIVLTMFPIVSSSFTSLQLPLSDTAIITYSTEQP